VQTKDSSFRAQCDMLAAWGNFLEGVSLVGSQTAVKALRACLCSSISATFYPAHGMPWSRRTADCPQGRETPSYYRPASLVRQPLGYEVWIHRLGYDSWHLLALSREPGFMPVLSEPSFNKALRSPQYTTPFLREWLPWLADELADDDNARLRLLDGFQTQAALLTATTPDLDELVSRGLREGAIHVPQEAL
jgi:hypothetical protein